MPGARVFIFKYDDLLEIRMLPRPQYRWVKGELHAQSTYLENGKIKKGFDLAGANYFRIL